MRHLSLSQAWDETKAIILREGRLLAAVALALVALPGVIEGLVSPDRMNAASTPWWINAVVILASLVALAGQLALIRLALGPSITVGAAIVHGIRRLPIYFLSALTVLIALLIAAIPFGVVLAAAGVPLPANGGPAANIQASMPVALAALVYLALILFVVIRMLMSAPIASAEAIGPIAIIRRSWELTAGNWWRLFAFLVMVLFAAVILAIAVRTAIGVVVEVLLGPVAPLSTSALVVALVLALLNSVLTVLLTVMLARIYVQLSGRGEAASVPTTGI